MPRFSPYASRPNHDFELRLIGRGGERGETVVEGELAVDQRPRIEVARFERGDRRTEAAASRTDDRDLVDDNRREIHRSARRRSALEDYGSARPHGRNREGQTVAAASAIDGHVIA